MTSFLNNPNVQDLLAPDYSVYIHSMINISNFYGQKFKVN